jgi:hypothetical protein
MASSALAEESDNKKDEELEYAEDLDGDTENKDNNNDDGNNKR